MSSDAAESERGIAIVAALWAAALFAIIVISVLQIVRADARIGRGREDVAQLSGVADAAVNITILSMLGPQASQPPVNAVPFNVPFVGYTARVVVQDEAGKIDLNMTSAAILIQLLSAVGLDTGSAKEMANRLVAWRGTDPAAQSGGSDVASATHGQLFQSVEELQLVAGMTPDLYRRIAPLVTVYSQTASVDPALSNAGVLNVFRTIDPSAEETWRRLQEEHAGLRTPQSSPGVAIGHAFTITAEVSGAGSARAIRTATIRLTGHEQDPLLIYRWN
jgi:general secretion pathway protein K